MEKVRYSLLMAIAALIWGTAFVAQRLGSGLLDAYSFNAARSLLGSLALLPVVLTLGRQGARRQFAASGPRRDLLAGGALCGLVLAVSTLLQQAGLGETTAGKAGFVTALYILIVPLLGLLGGRRVGRLVWAAVLTALVGMFRLCVKSGFAIGRGDLLVLGCAFAFSFHILAVDRFAKKVDGVLLSMAQFFFCGLFSLAPLLWGAAKAPAASDVLRCWLPIAYTAVFSSAVAYTLQIFAQRRLPPAVASLVMSLESVFAALSGWAILHERLTGRELSGCLLVFAATILAQVPAGGGTDAARAFLGRLQKKVAKSPKKG